MLIKAQRTMVKLGEKCYLPAMVEIKTSGGNRTNVDLICVLDVSGSMGGEKINLLKETMKFLLETLTPSDRLCIITFNNSAKRICPLKAVSK
jgi:Mg-chelatase subunit ChlD